MSRTVLARQIACSPVTIKKIERDERRPSEQLAELLATHLNVPPEDQEDFLRRARGEFVPQLNSPLEMSLAEARDSTKDNSSTNIDKLPHNLPNQSTSFVGRDQDLAEIASRLASPACRLLTILGPGGMGKTRLAIEAAAAQLPHFTDGVTYVALASVEASSSSKVVSPLLGAIADALRITFRKGGLPEQQLLDYLQRRDLLLVLDNFEHLLEGVELIGRLLEMAKDIKILVTSRVRLNLIEEWLWSLGGLSYSSETSPAPNINSTNNPAAELFIKRAQQLKPTFDLTVELPAILRICKLVEGMPLGLELAAAWVRQMPCATIADEIASEIDFLETNLRNVHERHRSIRALFTYSWQQLTPVEQTVLKTLSVFRGSFDRQAAKAVASASLRNLTSLVDKSLLSVNETGQYDFHMLLQQFAAEMLADDPVLADTARSRHGHYYLTFLANQDSRIKGPHMVDAVKQIDQDLDNVRLALDWAAEHDQRLLTRSVAFTLMLFFEIKSSYLEGETVLAAIVARLRQSKVVVPPMDTAAELPPPTKRWLSFGLCQSLFLFRLNRPDTETVLLEILSYLPGEQHDEEWHRGFCLLLLAFENGLSKQKYERAFTQLDEAKLLIHRTSDDYVYALTLIAETQLAQYVGRYELSTQSAAEGHNLINKLNDPHLQGYILSNLGRLAMHRGDFGDAERYHKETLALRKSMDHALGLTNTLRDLGQVAQLQGQFQTAAEYFQESVIASEEINLDEDYYKQPLADLAVARGEFDQAIRYFEARDRVRDVSVSSSPGWAWLGVGKLADAEAYFAEGLQSMLETGARPAGLDALIGFAHLEAQAGNVDRALELLGLVQNDPACMYELTQKVRTLQEELEAELDPAFVAAALGRGTALDVTATAEAILAQSGAA